MNNNIKLDLSIFFDFEYHFFDKDNINYRKILVLGIKIILEYKNQLDIIDCIMNVLHKQNEIYYNITKENKDDFDKVNNFLHVISEFMVDFNPDGFWSNYPNIWEDNINDINDYMNRINYSKEEKKNFWIHFEKFNDFTR